MNHESLIHRLRSRAMIEAPADNEPDTRAAFEDVPEITFEELAEIAALLNEAADALEGGDTLVSPAPETVCRVCQGYGFVAEKRTIDDGMGEVDTCPACDERDKAEVMAPPPPAVDLDAIKAREKAATKGPWANRLPLCDPRTVFSSDQDAHEPLIASVRHTVGGPEQEQRNSDFITHARQDIPALIAEVESLRGRLQALAPERKKEQ